MRILGIIFYSTIITLIGIALIFFSFNKLQPQDVAQLFAYLQESVSSRLVVGLTGLLLIVISVSFAQIILGKFQREKTIAFPTASGEVTVALTAVEDLIRRLSSVLPEVKELRPNVIARKGALVVDLRVTLRTGTNIPDLTNRLQEMIRSEIERVLGLEQEPVINVHIAKIVSAEEKDKKRKEFEKQETPIPFGGYGRV